MWKIRDENLENNTLKENSINYTLNSKLTKILEKTEQKIARGNCKKMQKKIKLVKRNRKSQP